MTNDLSGGSSSRSEHASRGTFFVAHIALVEQFDLPLSELVTEWVKRDEADCYPASDVGKQSTNVRAFVSFSTDEVSHTLSGALTLLLRFARDQATQLTSFLRRIDQELLLTEDSQSLSAARRRADGGWEVRCAKCQRVVRFTNSASNISCETCKRLLIRDTANLQESGERTESKVVYCLIDLPVAFYDHVVPDAFLAAFVQRDSDAFSPAGTKPDASGKHPTVSARQLPGKKHASRQGALAAMREFVTARLERLSKQRARLVREIA